MAALILALPIIALFGFYLLWTVGRIVMIWFSIPFNTTNTDMQGGLFVMFIGIPVALVIWVIYVKFFKRYPPWPADRNKNKKDDE